ncbi:MAG: FxsA family protein [Sulfurovum sp.]
MILLIIPFFLIELFLSLAVGEEIGFLWAVVWIGFSFLLGMILLKRSSNTMANNLESVKKGKLDFNRFKNTSISYVIGAILLIIPGVFSDFLGLLALIYTLYLQFIAKITPEQTNNYKKEGDNDVIDVEIID